MDFDIVYANTRIRAMKGRLFKQNDYEAALKSKNLHELATLLEHTGYRMNLESLKSHNREEIKRKLGENLITELERLKFLAPGSLKGLFDILRERYELENLKAIISLKIKAYKGDIRGSLPFPVKDHKLGSKLMESDLDGVIRILNENEYDLEGPYKLFREKGAIQPIFIALEKHYFKRLWGSLSWKNRVARSLVGEEMDLLNLLNTMRANELGIPVESLLLPRYKLDINPLLEGQPPKRFLSKIKRTPPYNKFVEKSIQEAEIGIKKYVLNKYRKAIEKDPSDIGVLLGYLKIKEQEVWNLMTICNSLEILEKGEIEELIF